MSLQWRRTFTGIMCDGRLELVYAPADKRKKSVVIGAVTRNSYTGKYDCHGPGGIVDNIDTKSLGLKGPTRNGCVYEKDAMKIVVAALICIKIGFTY